MHYSKLVCLMIVCSLWYGCATCVHGTTQKITVNTEPKGANVTVVGQKTQYTSPCEIELKRKSAHTLRIEKEKYEPMTVEIAHVLSGAVAGNILAGGLIGWGVDAATGSQYRLMPETVNVTLKPVVEELPMVDKEAIRPKNMAELLYELDEMKASGVINEKEYEMLRKKVLDRF